MAVPGRHPLGLLGAVGVFWFQPGWTRRSRSVRRAGDRFHCDLLLGALRRARETALRAARHHSQLRRDQFSHLRACSVRSRWAFGKIDTPLHAPRACELASSSSPRSPASASRTFSTTSRSARSASRFRRRCNSSARSARSRSRRGFLANGLAPRSSGARAFCSSARSSRRGRAGGRCGDRGRLLTYIGPSASAHCISGRTRRSVTPRSNAPPTERLPKAPKQTDS